MSIINSFDPADTAVIEPSSACPKVPDFPGTILSCFTEHFAELIVRETGAKQIDHIFAGRTVPIYEIVYKGNRIGFFQTLIGGAGAASNLEEVIAKGGRKILYFGSCGSLDSSITAGGMIVPVAAYRDEGVSYHYAPAGDYIGIGTADRLAGVFDGLGVPYVRTKTWTTDAFYRETERNMAARKREGCAAVEMECASLMAVGRFRGAEIYQFLYAADCLDAESWDRRILGRMPDDMRSAIAKVALETVIRL